MLSSAADMFRITSHRRYTNYLQANPRHRYIAYFALTCFTLIVLYYTILPRHVLSIPFSSPEWDQDLPPVDVNWEARAELVKKAFVHAYHGYEKFAVPKDITLSPADELRPLSKQPYDPFNGWGVTMFDSLDTMLLMDLKDEFQRTLPHVSRANFTLPEGSFTPYFETVIRYIGGLLSAYALSKEPILLKRADDLAMLLDGVFATPLKLPAYGVNTGSGRIKGYNDGILAELGTLQLEYTYLAKATGKKHYFERADNVIKHLNAADLTITRGMLPLRWDLQTGLPMDTTLSVGGQADSAHEYLLKQYLLTAKTDQASLNMYIRASTRILTDLMFITPSRKLVYVTDTAHVSRTSPLGVASHKLEHLSCFLPGLLALGAHTLPDSVFTSSAIAAAFPSHPTATSNSSYTTSAYSQLSHTFSGSLRDVHLWAADALAQTCWLTYADQLVGLGPEEVQMRTPFEKDGSGKALPWIDALTSWKNSGSRSAPPGTTVKPPVTTVKGRDYSVRTGSYLLRPETLESIYLMWRITGDVRWRQRGWKIFEALEKHTKTKAGYAIMRSVVHPATGDEMPSYFLAETLKYLYLMFKEEDLLPLDKWVFNTEAHAFPVFEWTEQERREWGIQ